MQNKFIYGLNYRILLFQTLLNKKRINVSLYLHLTPLLGKDFDASVSP
jgi:hypothetical protein